MKPREIDALVAEHVMGLNLKPHRDVALAAIGQRMVSCTGPTFSLRNGREIPMPPGEQLRKPEGSDYWNDRYYLHVAEVLGNEIASEVDAYRTEPLRYSTDIAAAWKVVNHLAAGWIWNFEIDQASCAASLGKNYASTPVELRARADTAPMAICLTALKAVGVEVAR